MLQHCSYFLHTKSRLTAHKITHTNMSRRDVASIHSGKSIRKQCLISPKDLHEKLKSKSDKVSVLDATWYMPAAGRNANTDFLEKHIPTAGRFDVDQICDKSSNLPHMLPTINQFERQISDLGISNEDEIVLYDVGLNYFASARAWWMFRTMSNHQKLFLLDGGLQAWIQAGYEVEKNKTQVKKKTFFVSQAFRRELLKTKNEIIRNIDEGKFQLIDARPHTRFTGEEQEFRQDLRSGNIPGSMNLELREVLDGKGSFKSEQELLELFKLRGIDLNNPIATTCGSGISACVLAFAFHLAGNPNVAVYDGSWTEYGQTTRL
ncbi:3-mercaptopyruvate sulfurtransferase-like [Schistocerca gregaria]|uniref:3-mercaptopyruvate sulfurtransferase-like n=1 Tax=Schistocerca gregaria TaxID=7010 RepID=UPI00211F1BA3|nr:3-mercaptopyruvate sulfurtransferase-like [Schistocerca gregaria]